MKQIEVVAAIIHSVDWLPADLIVVNDYYIHI